jgi:hypothetical protein
MVFVNLIDGISELLYKHNCVIIPDFGGFITNYKPSGFEESKHLISPSCKKVAFNQSLVENDGLLVNLWAQSKQISYSEALDEVLQFSKYLKNKIETNKSFDFKNIGSFYLNTEGRIIFVPYQGLNFLESSYGLFPVKIRTLHVTPVVPFESSILKANPIETLDEVKAFEFPKPDIKFKQSHALHYPFWFKAASILIFVALGLFTTYYFTINSKNLAKGKPKNMDNNAAILNLDSNLGNLKKTKKIQLVDLGYQLENKKIKAIKDKLDSLKGNTKSSQESYNVIIGYYPTEFNANKTLNKLRLEYPEAKLTDLNSEGYGIIVENFYKHNTANLFCVMLRQNGYKNVKIEKQMVFGK